MEYFTDMELSSTLAVTITLDNLKMINKMDLAMNTRKIQIK